MGAVKLAATATLTSAACTPTQHDNSITAQTSVRFMSFVGYGVVTGLRQGLNLSLAVA